VLDARTHDAQGVPVVVRISPEPDTLAAKYAQESKDKLDSSSGEDNEMYDSMGILRQVSQCQVFETRVISNMYVIGVAGLTLCHVYTCRDSLLPLTEDMKAVSASLWQNRWHLNLFFVGAGYLDSKYNQLLGWRDVVMYLTIPGIPITCSLLPTSWESASLGTEHPARWFFCCMLICRMYTVGCNHIGVPKLLQALLVVPFATRWQMAQLDASSACRPHGVLNYVMQIFVSEYKYGWEVNKVAGCTVMYVLAYLYLPVLAQKAVSKSPQTVRCERLLGMFCWLLFALIVTNWYHESPYRYVTTSGWSDAFPEQRSRLCFVVPVGGLADIFIICVLGAANAYLPIQLPDVVVNSLLGAMLLIPVTLIEPTQDFIAHMTATSSSVAQMCGLLACFVIYLGVASPLFQAVAMNVVTGIISSAKYMWPKFNKTSNLSVDSVRSLNEKSKATKVG